MNLVIDAFTFFQELDLLEFRLKYLDDVVDYFVIAESNLTHSGKSKPYHFLENESRFDRWKDKIIYIGVEQSTLGLSFDKVERYTPSDGAWILENQQRNALYHIQSILSDNDIVMISDLDEIPNKQLIYKMRAMDLSSFQTSSFIQLFHYYYMNCQNIGYERLWNGTVVTSGKEFKNNNTQYFRDNRNHFPKIDNGGFHFSFLGGIEKIREKIQSFAHTEFNKPELLTDEHILKCLDSGHDIFNRMNVQYKIYPLEWYPYEIRKFMLEYPQFIKK